MKILLLINFFYLNFFLTDKLLAQAFPLYNQFLDQKNKLNLKKAIKITLPIISVGTLGTFITKKIHPLEEIPLRNLGVENIEEVAEEGLTNEVDAAVKITLVGTGIVVFMAWSPIIAKNIYNLINVSSKHTLFNYKYFIKDKNLKDICNGYKSFSLTEKNFLTSELTLEELNFECNYKLKKNETYFIKLNDLSGKSLLNWEKLVFISD